MVIGRSICECSKWGIPQTGYLVPGRDGLLVWPDGRIVRTSPSPCLEIQIYIQWAIFGVCHKSKNQVFRPNMDFLGLLPSPKGLLTMFYTTPWSFRLNFRMQNMYVQWEFTNIDTTRSHIPHFYSLWWTHWQWCVLMSMLMHVLLLFCRF